MMITNINVFQFKYCPKYFALNILEEDFMKGKLQGFEEEDLKMYFVETAKKSN